MAFKKKLQLETDKTVTLGGRDVNGKPNPTLVEGYFLGSKTTPDKGYGEGKLHIFQTEEGNVGVWGKTRMNNQLTNDLVGNMVRVTFTGMSKPAKGRKPAYLYEVEYDSENVVDITGLDISTAGEPSADDNDSSADDTDAVAYEDSDPAQEEEAYDETPPARATAPKRPASTPDAARQAKVQELLNRTRKAV